MKRACLALSALLLALAGSLFATKTPQCRADKPHADEAAVSNPVGGLDDSPLGYCRVAPAIDDFDYEPASVAPNGAMTNNVAHDTAGNEEDDPQSLSYDEAYDFDYTCGYGCMDAGFAAAAANQAASDLPSDLHDYRSSHDCDYDEAVYGEPNDAAQATGADIANRSYEIADEYAYDTDDYNYEVDSDYTEEQYRYEDEYGYDYETGYSYDDDYNYEMETADAESNEEAAVTNNDDDYNDDDEYEYSYEDDYDDAYGYSYEDDYNYEMETADAESNEEAAVTNNDDDYSDEDTYDYRYEYEDEYDYYSDEYDYDAAVSDMSQAASDICNDYRVDGNHVDENDASATNAADDAAYEYGYEYDYESYDFPENNTSPEGDAGSTESDSLDRTYDEYDEYGYDYEYGFEYDGSVYQGAQNGAATQGDGVGEAAEAIDALINAVVDSALEVEKPALWKSTTDVAQAVGGMLASASLRAELQAMLQKMEERRMLESPCDWNGPGSWHAADVANGPEHQDAADEQERRACRSIASGLSTMADMLRSTADQLDGWASDSRILANANQAITR